MRTQRTTKGNQDAGSSCSCDRGLHRYLRNFGGGLNTPNPLSVRHCFNSMYVSDIPTLRQLPQYLAVWVDAVGV